MKLLTVLQRNSVWEEKGKLPNLVVIPNADKLSTGAKEFLRRFKFPGKDRRTACVALSTSLSPLATAMSFGGNTVLGAYPHQQTRGTTYCILMG